MAASGKEELCGVCEKVGKGNQKWLLCDGLCKKWFHITCVNILANEYQKIHTLQCKILWYCYTCKDKVSEILETHIVRGNPLQTDRSKPELEGTISSFSSKIEKLNNDFLLVNQRLSALEDLKNMLNQSHISQIANVNPTSHLSQGKESGLGLGLDVGSVVSRAKEISFCSGPDESLNSVNVESVSLIGSTCQPSKCSQVTSDSMVPSKTCSEGLENDINLFHPFHNSIPPKIAEPCKPSFAQTLKKIPGPLCRSKPSPLVSISRPIVCQNGSKSNDSLNYVKAVKNSRPSMNTSSTKSRSIFRSATYVHSSVNNFGQSNDNFVVGNAASSDNLMAVDKMAYIFVSRVACNVTLKAMEDHISNICGAGFTCVELRTKYPGYKSFKVSVPSTDKVKLLKAENWPKGILVSNFLFPRKKSMSQEGNQQENENPFIGMSPLH